MTLTFVLGPIGVSAIFYLYITREFLRGIPAEGQAADDLAKLAEVMNVVIWFLTMCSIFVHGLSIPLGKLGLYLPRTISTAISSGQVSRNPTQPRTDGTPESSEQPLEVLTEHETASYGAPKWIPRRLFSLWRTLASASQDLRHVAARADDTSSPGGSTARLRMGISGPTDARLIGRAVGNTADVMDATAADVDGPKVRTESPTRDMHGQQRMDVNAPTTAVPMRWQRSIRFPDEHTSDEESAEL